MQKSDAERRLVTRRSWAAMLAAAPVAIGVVKAQVASTPQPAPPLAAPSAADNVGSVSAKLAEIEVPMSLAPAFIFHV